MTDENTCIFKCENLWHSKIFNSVTFFKNTSCVNYLYILFHIQIQHVQKHKKELLYSKNMDIYYFSKFKTDLKLTSVNQNKYSKWLNIQITLKSIYYMCVAVEKRVQKPLFSASL